MPAVTITNLSEEAYRALNARAVDHGRTIEAEIVEILEAAVLPARRVKLGSLLASIGQEARLADEDVESLQSVRDKTSAEPLGFA